MRAPDERARIIRLTETDPLGALEEWFVFLRGNKITGKQRVEELSELCDVLLRAEVLPGVASDLALYLLDKARTDLERFGALSLLRRVPTRYRAGWTAKQIDRAWREAATEEAAVVAVACSDEVARTGKEDPERLRVVAREARALFKEMAAKNGSK